MAQRFKITHDGGTLDEWDVISDPELPSASPTAAARGTDFGLILPHNPLGQVLVKSFSSTTGKLVLDFAFNTNNCTTDPSLFPNILRLGTLALVTGPGGEQISVNVTNVVEIRFNRSSLAQPVDISLFVQQDGPVDITSGQISLADGWHEVELRMARATSGPNGTISLVIDGSVGFTFSTWDNSSTWTQIDALGVLAIADDPTQESYIDEITLNDATLLIGPDPESPGQLVLEGVHGAALSTEESPPFCRIHHENPDGTSRGLTEYDATNNPQFLIIEGDAGQGGTPFGMTVDPPIMTTAWADKAIDPDYGREFRWGFRINGSGLAPIAFTFPAIQMFDSGALRFEVTLQKPLFSSTAQMVVSSAVNGGAMVGSGNLGLPDGDSYKVDVIFRRGAGTGGFIVLVDDVQVFSNLALTTTTISAPNLFRVGSMSGSAIVLGEFAIDEHYFQTPFTIRIGQTCDCCPREVGQLVLSGPITEECCTLESGTFSEFAAEDDADSQIAVTTPGLNGAHRITVTPVPGAANRGVAIKAATFEDDIYAAKFTVNADDLSQNAGVPRYDAVTLTATGEVLGALATLDFDGNNFDSIEQGAPVIGPAGGMGGTPNGMVIGADQPNASVIKLTPGATGLTEPQIWVEFWVNMEDMTNDPVVADAIIGIIEAHTDSQLFQIEAARGSSTSYRGIYVVVPDVASLSTILPESPSENRKIGVSINRSILAGQPLSTAIQVFEIANGVAIPIPSVDVAPIIAQNAYSFDDLNRIDAGRNYRRVSLPGGTILLDEIRVFDENPYPIASLPRLTASLRNVTGAREVAMTLYTDLAEGADQNGVPLSTAFHPLPAGNHVVEIRHNNVTRATTLFLDGAPLETIPDQFWSASFLRPGFIQAGLTAPAPAHVAGSYALDDICIINEERHRFFQNLAIESTGEIVFSPPEVGNPAIDSTEDCDISHAFHSTCDFADYAAVDDANGQLSATAGAQMPDDAPGCGIRFRPSPVDRCRMPPSANVRFADDFETGDKSRWHSERWMEGVVEVTPAAAMEATGFGIRFGEFADSGDTQGAFRSLLRKNLGVDRRVMITRLMLDMNQAEIDSPSIELGIFFDVDPGEFGASREVLVVTQPIPGVPSYVGQYGDVLESNFTPTFAIPDGPTEFCFVHIDPADVDGPDPSELRVYMNGAFVATGDTVFRAKQVRQFRLGSQAGWLADGSNKIHADELIIADADTFSETLVLPPAAPARAAAAKSFTWEPSDPALVSLFQVDPSAIPEGATEYDFFSHENPSDLRVQEFSLRRLPGSPAQIRMAVRDSGPLPTETAWLDIADAPNLITASLNDSLGAATISVPGGGSETLSGLDFTGVARPDHFEVGLLDATPAISGYYDIDSICLATAHFLHLPAQTLALLISPVQPIPGKSFTIPVQTLALLQGQFTLASLTDLTIPAQTLALTPSPFGPIVLIPSIDGVIVPAWPERVMEPAWN